MTHAHITQDEARIIKNHLDEIAEIADKNNDDTQEIIYSLINIFTHEMERIVE